MTLKRLQTSLLIPVSAEVGLIVDRDVGILTWHPDAVNEELADRLKAEISRAWRMGIRRVEVEIADNDTEARRQLHRAGLRHEGRRRAASVTAGQTRDLLLYAILSGEPTEGIQGFSAVMDSVLPTKRVIGHALARNHRGQVLLLETNYKSDWELPGGVVEPGETPRLGTMREIMEELGIRVELAQPALIDWMPSYLGWSDAVEFIFDLGLLDDSLITQMRPNAEIRDFHWVEPSDASHHVTALSHRRISLLLDGYRGYTEAGYPVGLESSTQ